MFRNINFSVLFFLFVLFFAPSQANGKLEFIHGKTIQLHATFFRTGPNYIIDSVPYSIRAVPLHPDDDYLSGYPHATETLPNHRMTLDSSLPLGLGLTFSWNSFIETGVYIFFFAEEAVRYSQNQWGDNRRLDSASLRWYQTCVQSSGVITLSGALTSPWLMLWSDYSMGFVICRIKTGVYWDVRGYNIGLESGYDRYGFDETWKELYIEEVRDNRLFSAIEIAFNQYYLHFACQYRIPSYRPMNNPSDLEFQRFKGDQYQFILTTGINIPFKLWHDIERD